MWRVGLKVLSVVSMQAHMVAVGKHSRHETSGAVSMQATYRRRVSEGREHAVAYGRGGKTKQIRDKRYREYVG